MVLATKKKKKKKKKRNVHIIWVKRWEVWLVEGNTCAFIAAEVGWGRYLAENSSAKSKLAESFILVRLGCCK